ncbi:STAS domain-containing protein [Streptomyces sp. NPDC051940]|uniref:STAS domain-containing protein n=1 Tax=Streptomyces sp. NPDC051940 TaxID=3155675 RepID=UPI00344AF5A7
MTSTDSLPTLRTEAQDGCTLVVLGGELDAFAGGRLGPELDALTAPDVPEPPTLVIDLREVTFADCSGLSLLVRSRRRARRLGGSVRLVCAAPRILRVLRLTRLDTEFDIYTDWPPLTGSR